MQVTSTTLVSNRVYDGAHKASPNAVVFPGRDRCRFFLIWPSRYQLLGQIQSQFYFLAARTFSCTLSKTVQFVCF